MNTRTAYCIRDIRDSLGLTRGFTRAIHSTNEKTLAHLIALEDVPDRRHCVPRTDFQKTEENTP